MEVLTGLLRWIRGPRATCRAFCLAAAAVLLIAAAAPLQVRAQGSAQVVISGVPPVLPSPFRDVLERNYDQGRYFMQFTYVGERPASFRFRVTLEKDSRPLIETTSEPTRFEPGTYVYHRFDESPAIHFSAAFSDLIDQLPAEVQRTVVQGGVLPEGDYTLYVEPLPERQTIAAPPSMTPFQVLYPEPASPITPVDQAAVTSPLPTFAWTPATGAPAAAQFDYEVLLVEMLPNQTPLQAIRANRPHFRRSFSNQASFVYTPELLPLEEGERYAWQITTRGLLDGRDLPASDDGQSEIHTFHYGAKGVSESSELAEIVIEPGLARLVELSRLETEQGDLGTVMNGRAALVLELDEPVTIPVDVRDLRVPRGQGRPTATGGFLRARLADGALPFDDAASEMVRLTDLVWQRGSGFETRGELRLPNGETVEARGELQLTQQGLSGTLEAAGDPLFALGDEVARLAATRAVARFPGGQMRLSGNVELFGRETNCRVENFGLTTGSSGQARIDCRPNVALPLVPDADVIRLQLHRVDGPFEFDAEAGTSGYDLDLTGRVDLAIQGGGQCGTEVALNLTDAAGVQIQRAVPSCNVADPEINLGLAHLQIANLALDRLSYAPREGWDFAFETDASLTFPLLDGAALPTVEDVSIGLDGIALPSMDFEESDLTGAGTTDLGALRVGLRAFSMGTITFPWLEWSRDYTDGDLGPWPFSMDLDLSFTGAAGRLPLCLTGQTLTIRDAGISGGTFGGTLATTDLRGCSYGLGSGGYALTLNAVSGQLTTTFSSDTGFRLDPKLALDADLTLGEPFTCARQSDVLDLGDEALRIDAVGGLISGTAENVVPTCPIEVGPFSARVTGSELRFGAGRDSTGRAVQHARLDAEAELALAETGATGEASVDLVDGTFLTLDFELDDPFTWNVPQDDPALSFRIDEARIDLDGLHIDGRNTLRAGSEDIGVTFDNVLLGLRQLDVRRGRIIFDEAFGFAAGYDPATQELDYRAVASPDAFTEDPGAYFGLGGTVVINQDGLTSTGVATAMLRLPQLDDDPQLAVRFSDDFQMALQPFGIAAGKAEFVTASMDDAADAPASQVIAYADASGLHPDLNLIATVLPDSLALPTADVAYLKLKDGQGDLLVQVQQSGSDLVLTSAGTGPQLVLPGLQGTQPDAPTLDVTLDNVTVDAQSFAVTGGTIRATLGSPMDLSPLGVPLALTEIRYGTEVVDGASRTALLLEGQFQLFDETLAPGDGTATLYVESGTTAELGLDLRDLTDEITLAGHDLVTLQIDSVGGAGSFPLDGGGTPTFDFGVRGLFSVNTPADSTVAQSAVVARLSRSAGASQPSFSLSSSSSSPLAERAEISFDAFRLGILTVDALTLAYDPVTNDFDFSTTLSAELGLTLPEGERITFPIDDVKLTENGFVLPPQQVNESSVPGLTLPRVALGPVEVQPIELRTPRISFNWFTGESLVATPELDLAVHLPTLNGADPNPDDGLIINSVTYQDGTLSGSATYTPLNPIVVPLAPSSMEPPELSVTQIAGSLSVSQQGLQEVDVDLSASLRPGTGPFDTPDPQACPQQPTFDLQLVSGPGLAGAASDLTPCGDLTFGPITLALQDAAVAFSFTQDTQRAVGTGTVQVTLPGSGTNPQPVQVSANDVSIDFIDGTLTGGAVTLDTPFALPVPLDASDPFFTFALEDPGPSAPVAVLDQNGLTIGQTTGELDLDPGSTSVSFSNLRFSLDPEQDFQVTGGSATIAADVAVESAANPIEWALVDTSQAFTVNSGVRLTLDAQMTLDATGLHFTGGGEADARLFDQEFLNTDLKFRNDFTVDPRTADITAGRADLYIGFDGPTSTPTVWFDKDGMHTSAGGAAMAVAPDTLPLPTMDVAYLVLRDPDSDSLLVETTESGNVTRLQTLDGESVDLVIAALGTPGNAPRTEVGLNATIDDAFNITVDSLGFRLDSLQQGGLDLGTDYPFDLKHAYYRRNAPTPFGVTAIIELPELLDEGTDLLVDLQVGADGFSGRTQAGLYAQTYDPQQADQTPVAQAAFPQNSTDSSFVARIRGIDFTFSTQPSNNVYKLSGDFESELLKTDDDQGNEEPVLVHMAGTYDHAQGSWQITASANHLQGEIPMAVARFEPDQNNGLVVHASDTEFSLALSGRFTVPDLMDDFAVTVQDLKLGVEKVGQNTELLASVGTVTSSQLPQSVSLFDGTVDLTVTSLSAQIDESPLVVKVTTSGDLTFVDETVNFTNLTVGSDGSFSTDQIGVSDVQLLDQYLVLETLAFQQPQPAGAITVRATAQAQLPEPFASKSQGQADPDDEGADGTASLTIDVSRSQSGSVNIATQGPSFTFDTGYEIGNNTATEFELGGIATLDLTGVAVDLNLDNPQLTPTVYVAAAAYLENETSKRIEFGEAANIRQKPGIKVGLDNDQLDLAYNATAQASAQNPLFEFSTSFFGITITSIALSGDVQSDPLRVAIGGEAELSLPGVAGSSGYRDFAVGKDGIEDLGRLDGGGTFFLLPTGDDSGLLTLELGTFTTDENTTVDIHEIGADPGDSDGVKNVDAPTTTSVPVKRYIRFANTTGDDANAISVSFSSADFGIAAGVQEVLYYEKQDGGTYLRIVDAFMEMHETASVHAYMEYMQDGSDFLLRVAGNGTFGYGSTAKSLSAVGKFAQINGELSMGIFVAVEGAGIPILPGVVELESLGGGFFLRPDQRDFQLVQNSVSLYDDPVLTAQRQSVRERHDAIFSIMVYAGVGVLGSQGAYTMTGNAMVTITSHWTMLDATADIGFLPSQWFGTGFVTAIEYDPAMFSGAIVMDVSVLNYVLNADAKVDFFVKDQNAWGVTGDAGIDIMHVFNLDIYLVVSNDGFYVEGARSLKLGGGIVSLDGGVEVAVWNVAHGSFGAFATAWLKIDLWVDTLGAEGIAAYINDSSGYLIYGYGGVDFPVVGWVDGHASLRNDHFSAGRGKSERYEAMINDAKSQARNIGQKANEAVQEAQQAQAEAERAAEAARRKQIIGDLSASVDELQRAGYTLHTQGSFGRGLVYMAMKNNEMNILNAWPTALDNVGNLITTDHPETDADTEYQEMTTRLDALSTMAPDVQQRLADTVVELEQVVIENRERAQNLASPVQNVDTTFAKSSDGTIIGSPSFSINAGQAQTNQSELSTTKSSIEALQQTYEDAIAAALNDLEQFDQLGSGEAVVDYGAMAAAIGVGDDASAVAQQTYRDYTFQPPAVFGFFGGGSQDQQQDDGPASGQTMNDLARTYAGAVEALDAYFATRVGALQERRRWAQYSRPDSHQVRSALRSRGNSYVQASALTASKFSTLKDVVGQRKYFVGWLASDLDVGAGNQAKQQGRSAVDAMQRSNGSYDRTGLEGLYVETGMELWARIHHEGLEVLYDTMTARTDRTIDQHQTARGDLIDSYESFSGLIDEFFALKAELGTIVYGMTEEYAVWRRDAMGDTTAHVPTQILARLAESLEPPEITSVTVTPHQQGYFSYADLNWTAVPRNDHTQVVETSYDIEPTQARYGGAPDDIIEAYASYKSLGDMNGPIRRYVYDTHTGESRRAQNNELKFTVRARSGGGGSAARTATLTLPIDATSSTSPSSGQVMNTDDSPPTTPDLYLDYMDDGSQRRLLYAKYGRPSGYRQVVEYWSTDSTEVRMVVESVDRQSDVVDIEYAVGTAQGDSNVVAWKSVPGQRIYGTSGDANWRQRIIVRGLDLSSTAPTYISVRTTNGAGLTSDIEELAPVFYDATPPTFLKGQFSVQTSPSSNWGWQSDGYVSTWPERQHWRYESGQSGPVFDAPSWHQQRRNEPNTARDEADVTFAFPAQDQESGIDRFYIVLGEQHVAEPDAVLDSKQLPDDACSQQGYGFGCVITPSSGSTRTLTWDQWRSSFADSIYAYVRAQNHAGGQTRTEVIPLAPEDQTGPTTPTVTAQPVATPSRGILARRSVKQPTLANPDPSGARARVFITQAAGDKESGIRGYQYALGTTPGGTDLRAWPAGDAVDWPALTSAQLAAASPPSYLLDNPGTDDGFYVTVRAVNGQGMLSSTHAVGPIIIDTTPPQVESITMDRQPVSWTTDPVYNVMVEAMNLGDPESGLQGDEAIVELFALRSGNRYDDNYFQNSGPSTQLFDASLTFQNVSRSFYDYGLKVVVEMTNNAGLSKVQEKTFVINPEYAPWPQVQETDWTTVDTNLENHGVDQEQIDLLRQTLNRMGEPSRTQSLSQLAGMGAEALIQEIEEMI